MARYDDVLANILSVVPELSSDSETALYKKIAEVVSNNLDAFAIEISNNNAQITDLINKLRYGKKEYLISVAKAYQEGDALTETVGVFNGIPIVSLAYSVIDETKQIITQASCEVFESQILMKVAMTDPNTNKLVKVSDDKFPSFLSYMLNYEVIGTNVSITTNDANVLDFISEIAYYPSTDLFTLKSNILSALTTFKETYDFNGRFYTNDLEFYLKANVVGIRNVAISSTKIDSVSFTDDVDLTAGYFEYIDNIDTQITYVAI